MTPVSPEPLLHLLGNVLAAKYLMVANEVGLFSSLAPGPATAEELAARIRMPHRTLRLLVDALVASRFVERVGDQYQNSLLTATFLSGGPNADLRPILRLWDQIVYPQWMQLETALRADKATFEFGDFTDEQRRVFSEGVEALTAPSAHALAQTYDWSRHQRILDLGGGTGSFLLAILRRHPGLQATLLELPATAAMIRQRLASAATPPPLDIIEGNFLEDHLPQGYDAILLANVLHLFSPARNTMLLQRVRSAASVDARLLLIDFWTDAGHTQPVFAALMAGEFQIVSGEGDVYSVDEGAQWLSASGWRLVTHQPLAGAASVIIAEPVGE